MLPIQNAACSACEHFANLHQTTEIERLDRTTNSFQQLLALMLHKINLAGSIMFRDLLHTSTSAAFDMFRCRTLKLPGINPKSSQHRLCIHQTHPFKQGPIMLRDPNTGALQKSRASRPAPTTPKPSRQGCVLRTCRSKAAASAKYEESTEVEGPELAYPIGTPARSYKVT